MDLFGIDCFGGGAIKTASHRRVTDAEAGTLGGILCGIGVLRSAASVGFQCAVIGALQPVILQCAVERFFNAGCQIEHRLLLREGIVGGFRCNELLQILIRHKAKGDITAAFQKVDLIRSGDQRVESGIQMIAVPIQNIANGAHGIGKGGAFIIGETVAAGP